jgi:hypothetical protein
MKKDLEAGSFIAVRTSDSSLTSVEFGEHSIPVVGCSFEGTDEKAYTLTFIEVAWSTESKPQSEREITMTWQQIAEGGGIGCKSGDLVAYQSFQLDAVKSYEVLGSGGVPTVGIYKQRSAGNAAEVEALRLELTGLLSEREFVNFNDIGEGYISFPVFDDFANTKQGDELKEWVKLTGLEEEGRWEQVARIAVVFVGICMLVYSILLVGAYWVDSVNTVLEFSLLGILTLGRLQIAGVGEKGRYNTTENGGGRRVSRKDIFLIGAIGVNVGCLMVSGLIFSCVAWVINILGDFFGI